jgi:hypothetical protein
MGRARGRVAVLSLEVLGGRDGGVRADDDHGKAAVLRPLGGRGGVFGGDDLFHHEGGGGVPALNNKDAGNG